MNALSKLQVDLIRADIRQNGIELLDLEEDLLDHICCAMEEEGGTGRTFEEMYAYIKKKVCPNGYREIQEKTSYLITLKFNKMKKTMNVLGFVGSALLLIGAIMKSLHLPGAAASLVIGGGVLIIGYLPMMLILAMKQTDTLLGKIRNISGYAGSTLIIVGIIREIMHWPLGQVLLFTGVFIFLLLFVPLFFRSIGKDAMMKIQPATLSVLLIAIVSSFFAFSIKRPSNAYVQGLLVVNENIEQSFQFKHEILINRRSTATELSKASEEAIDYINGLKNYMVKQVDEDNPSDKNLNIYNIFYIKPRLDQILTSNTDTYNGQELFNRIRHFVEVLHQQNPQSKTILWNGEDGNTWTEQHFKTKPLFSIYTTLSSFQLEIADLEMETL